MDPLYALFNPLVDLVNRRIGESTPARRLAKSLDGRTVAVRVRNTGLAVAASVAEGRLRLTTTDEVEPDALIEGSLFALARLAGEDSETLVRDGSVGFSGDAIVANEFRELLRHGRPDWEEQLAGLVGDAAAHGVGEAVRGLGRWGREARSTLQQNIGEYLQEESRTLPTRFEVEEFGEAVQVLRDDVARLEARLARLEAASGSGSR